MSTARIHRSGPLGGDETQRHRGGGRRAGALLRRRHRRAWQDRRPSDGEVDLDALEQRQAALIDALRRAEGAAVSYAKLSEAGIEFPASVACELELAGIEIERVTARGAGGERMPALRISPTPGFGDIDWSGFPSVTERSTSGRAAQAAPAAEAAGAHLRRYRISIAGRRTTLGVAVGVIAALATIAAIVILSVPGGGAKPRVQEHRASAATGGSTASGAQRHSPTATAQRTPRSTPARGGSTASASPSATQPQAAQAPPALTPSGRPQGTQPSRARAQLAQAQAAQTPRTYGLAVHTQSQAQPAATKAAQTHPVRTPSAQTPSVQTSPPHVRSGATTAPPAQSAPAPPVSAASAAQLEAEGHSLLESGRYASATPILERAVAATGQQLQGCIEPSSEACLTYAYALYDLGRSLDLGGDPARAIPILESRLQINNQRPVVQAALQEARASRHG